MLTITFITLAFLATLIGGLIGINYRDRLNLVLGFAAGVLVAVVAFDIFPELIEMTEETGIDPMKAMIAFIFGFFLFHIFEKLFLVHHAHESEYGPHRHPAVGTFSALALALHTFMDGLAIGLSFHVSPTLGMAVGLGIIAHGFSDGLNTVSLMLLHGNTLKKTMGILLLDAAAPILGGIASIFFVLSEDMLVLAVGFIGGFLLYIGASDVLPEAHSKESSYKTILATLFGVFFIFLISTLV